MQVLNSISSTISLTLCCYFLEMSFCWSVADIGDRVMVEDTVVKIPKLKRAQQHTNVTRRNKSWTWIDFGTFIYLKKGSSRQMLRNCLGTANKDHSEFKFTHHLGQNCRKQRGLNNLIIWILYVYANVVFDRYW